MAPGALAATAPRAYELVSPVDKGAADVGTGAGAMADGDAVAYVSYGAFPGTSNADFGTIYRSQRTGSGWTTDVLSPKQPFPANTSLATTFNPEDFSADLRTLYGIPFNAPGPMTPGDTNQSIDVYASTVGGELHWLSPGVDPSAPGDSVYQGRSDDNRHVVFESSKQILPDVPGGTNEVYELVDGAPRLVSTIDVGGTMQPAPNGATYGGSRGSPYLYAPADRRAVSADGSHVFFTADTQLYVRLDGTTTKLVSASQVTGSVGDPAPSGAQFAGASDDGRFVTFVSQDPLVDGAVGGGLYAYRVDTGTLRLLAETDVGYPGGNVRTAPDGSRAYFITVHEFDGQGQDIFPNLWVVDADGTRHFIATLSTGDTSLAIGGENQNLVAITGDGKKLAFESLANLTRYDAGGAREVYVYDDATQKLACASCPAGGADPAGDADLHNPNNYMNSVPRGFTTDGGLFFETPQALADADTDAKSDVYEYVGGRAELISTGTSTDTHYVDSSADGSSVFLLTRDSLVPADIDHGYQDMYVSRVGGGFPDTSTPGCSGAACRPGPSPQPAAPAAPGTATAFDVTPGTAGEPAPTFKVSAISAAARRGFARTGQLTLKVKVSGSAVLTATGRGQIGKQRVTIASGATHRLSAGSATLTVKLTSAAKRALVRSGRLTIRLTVACSDTTREVHATLVLHHANSTKGGR
ncbi:hypothetical protein DSM104299_05501 [Baekduia alba]|uniref:TolB family protein n=1 Tax=Baekduia alba TaxID=2997333 RepID=UPI00234244BE|nr:hypothetical protein [Baekduia alba]WCB96735.1 hypothetical protein DSM104299_05501 [Baekduia alba]